ncbi:hypothetical protein [Leifsonia shinshuensis]|uniref:Uncharacterized protein n=1 Tax=Leifsonia shinshuensis TaxID=150026 RepID=A0A7G6YD98_9MICO|nr:hypothetical protein [Leifsonia shinshuensis]QNE36463.1 hypothetical protein F1C12_15990 [Leifsonia shinshuensis]
MTDELLAGAAGARPWTDADSALWHTARLLAAVEQAAIAGGAVADQGIRTLFPLQDGEVALAQGTYTLDSMRAIGDGSYQRTGAFAFGTGVIGLAVTAGTLAANASRNNAARAQAMADAQVVWRPDSAGMLTVTDRGFVIVTGTGTFRWDWASVDLMQVVGFNTVVLQGRSDRGPVTWRIYSHWAELLFVLWARARHPGHPQLAGRAWLPERWEAWAAWVGHPLPEPPAALP